MNYVVYGIQENAEIISIKFTQNFGRVRRQSAGKPHSVIKLSSHSQKTEAKKTRKAFIQAGRRLGWPLKDKIYM